MTQPPDPGPAPMPRLLVLTDRHRAAAAGHTLEGALDAALDAGAPAIVLRERDLPRPQRARLAERLRTRTATVGAQLWLGGDPELAADVGADGVHLPSRATVVRAPGLAVTGRSCHDADEVVEAVAAELDHVTISPVATTASTPGYGPPLGAEGVARLAAVAGALPVYTLGGVDVADVATWRAVGAYGVAVLGAVLGAAHPDRAVAELLAELGASDEPPLHPAGGSP